MGLIDNHESGGEMLARLAFLSESTVPITRYAP
jgi:hypothetical protein